MQQEKLFKCTPTHEKKSIVNLYQKKLLECFSEDIKISNQKFIVVATSRMIVIHRSSVDLRRRTSSAFQSFPIISSAGSAAFPMLALVGNARDSVL